MIHRWITPRSTDATAIAIIWVTLLQLGVGLVMVKTVAGQSQEVVNNQLQYRQQTLDDRMARIDQMNIPARLAVLEQSAAEVSQVKLLIYGVFVTLVGSLFAQIIQIRGQRKRRHYPGDDE